MATFILRSQILNINTIKIYHLMIFCQTLFLLALVNTLEIQKGKIPRSENESTQNMDENYGLQFFRPMYRKFCREKSGSTLDTNGDFEQEGYKGLITGRLLLYYTEYSSALETKVNTPTTGLVEKNILVENEKNLMLETKEALEISADLGPKNSNTKKDQVSKFKISTRKQQVKSMAEEEVRSMGNSAKGTQGAGKTYSAHEVVNCTVRVRQKVNNNTCDTVIGTKAVSKTSETGLPVPCKTRVKELSSMINRSIPLSDVITLVDVDNGDAVNPSLADSSSSKLQNSDSNPLEIDGKKYVDKEATGSSIQKSDETSACLQKPNHENIGPEKLLCEGSSNTENYLCNKTLTNDNVLRRRSVAKESKKINPELSETQDDTEAIDETRQITSDATKKFLKSDVTKSKDKNERIFCVFDTNGCIKHDASCKSPTLSGTSANSFCDKMPSGQLNKPNISGTLYPDETANDRSCLVVKDITPETQYNPNKTADQHQKTQTTGNINPVDLSEIIENPRCTRASEEQLFGLIFDDGSGKSDIQKNQESIHDDNLNKTGNPAVALETPVDNKKLIRPHGKPGSESNYSTFFPEKHHLSNTNQVEQSNLCHDGLADTLQSGESNPTHEQTPQDVVPPKNILVSESDIFPKQQLNQNTLLNDKKMGMYLSDDKSENLSDVGRKSSKDLAANRTPNLETPVFLPLKKKDASKSDQVADARILCISDDRPSDNSETYGCKKLHEVESGHTDTLSEYCDNSRIEHFVFEDNINRLASTSDAHTRSLTVPVTKFPPSACNIVISRDNVKQTLKFRFELEQGILSNPRPFIETILTSKKFFYKNPQAPLSVKKFSFINAYISVILHICEIFERKIDITGCNLKWQFDALYYGMCGIRLDFETCKFKSFDITTNNGEGPVVFDFVINIESMKILSIGPYWNICLYGGNIIVLNASEHVENHSIRQRRLQTRTNKIIEISDDSRDSSDILSNASGLSKELASENENLRKSTQLRTVDEVASKNSIIEQKEVHIDNELSGISKYNGDKVANEVSSDDTFEDQDGFFDDELFEISKYNGDNVANEVSADNSREDQDGYTYDELFGISECDGDNVANEVSAENTFEDQDGYIYDELFEISECEGDKVFNGEALKYNSVYQEGDPDGKLTKELDLHENENNSESNTAEPQNITDSVPNSRTPTLPAKNDKTDMKRDTLKKNSSSDGLISDQLKPEVEDDTTPGVIDEQKMDAEGELQKKCAERPEYYNLYYNSNQ